LNDRQTWKTRIDSSKISAADAASAIVEHLKKNGYLG